MNESKRQAVEFSEADYLRRAAKLALKALGKLGVMRVLCEGGLTLARSLAEAGLVDEWLTVMAPVVIGSRRMAKAIRGSANCRRCSLVSGDSFYSADFSDFAAWSGGGTERWG